LAGKHQNTNIHNIYNAGTVCEFEIVSVLVNTSKECIATYGKLQEYIKEHTAGCNK